jgi:alkanesulfonate monooxygenase SsuD/methylene tetrahydromethanopterin reductase-like flavin-dependent oxidoreductase (luciferase family)/predicted kinase
VTEALNLPSPCVLLLVGPGAAGKSTWAATHFPAGCVVGSDQLRALVGTGEDDLTASADAFVLLDEIVAKRLRRRLTTVIDTLGLDAERRERWRALARQHDLPCMAVAFDTPPAQCRERNRTRAKRIPADVLTGQLRAWAKTRELLAAEGPVIQAVPPTQAAQSTQVGQVTDVRVTDVGRVRVVPEAFVDAAAASRRQRERPSDLSTDLRFGLHLGQFTFTGAAGPQSGGAAAIASGVRRIAQAAEEAGFDAIYLLDHFRQIPQLGRPWEDFLESYTTLAYLAACTERVRLGALVTGITYRNIPHLGKIIATLDVLSQGRAICGLGLAWFKQEHLAYGWDFPAVNDRYALLEDALRLLPLLWGKGSPRFEGRKITVPEAICYPRPLQEHVPIIVGGGGERRTLRLAAEHADAANVFGDLATVRHKAAVLREHNARAGRSTRLTHLSTALVGEDDRHVNALVERHRRRNQDPARYAVEVNAGTIEDHIGRCRELAEAGVSEVIFRLPDLTDPGPLHRFANIIAAFR